MDAMYYLIAVCFALATANGATDNLIQRWMTQSQLPMPVPWQPGTTRPDALPVDIECCDGAKLYERSLMYVILTKQVLIVSGKESVTPTPTPGESTDLPAPLPYVNPPPGYKYVPATGNMYKFYEDNAPWDEAEAICEGEGAHLVVLDDAVEAVAVIDLIGKTGHRYTWIGLRDKRPQGAIDWRTVDGEPVSEVYNNWDVGRPYTSGDWTCGYLFDNKFLYDSPCNVPNPFTCEISQQ